MTIDNPEGPILDRKIDIKFKGDWGFANLTQVARWLQATVIDRTAEGSMSAIYWGTGGADGIRAVRDRDVDVAVVTPAPFARMAVAGTGAFAGESMPDLRAIGVVPQDDRLLVLANERLGVSTLGELAGHPGPWVLGTCNNDGTNLIGWANDQLLAEYGLDQAAREAKGVKEVRVERPIPVLNGFADGEIDVLVMEGISIPIWERIWDQQPGTKVLTPEAEVLAKLAREFGWPSRPVRKGWWKQREIEGDQLDFADFLVLTHKDFDEEIVHLITWCMFETIPLLEMHFRHLDPARSGVTYPLEPKAMAAAPIELHAGAQRYLDER